jgi:hypothetical protein
MEEREAKTQGKAEATPATEKVSLPEDGEVRKK